VVNLLTLVEFHLLGLCFVNLILDSGRVTCLSAFVFLDLDVVRLPVDCHVFGCGALGNCLSHHEVLLLVCTCWDRVMASRMKVLRARAISI
jgi:hypothetical protein